MKKEYKSPSLEELKAQTVEFCETSVSSDSEGYERLDSVVDKMPD